MEWLTQLLQLRYGRETEDLRTVSTLGALRAASEHGYLADESREYLEEAWLAASQIRSALKLWSGKSSDILPFDRDELEGIAGVLGMRRGRTFEIEEHWLSVARRARAVFEQEFFEYVETDERFPLH